ncbi:hypothetical protein Tco_1002219 [Tanacetum coccineum]|uniref:Uncharacterized protein n=1 Tax=Tanacetum coccineum TaxID=301880 RepID=A0ABQ5F5M2_9ASTR
MHIEIRHHLIRDSYEKKLIQVIKIHTDQNVTDLLIKAFDATRLCINMDPHEFSYVYLIFSIAAWKKTNGIAGIKDNDVAGQAQKEKEHEQEYILIPLCTTDPIISQGSKDCEGDAGMKPTE